MRIVNSNDLSPYERERRPVFRLPTEIAFDTPSGEVRREVELRERSSTLRFALPTQPSGVRLDPDGWLLYAWDQGGQI